MSFYDKSYGNRDNDLEDDQMYEGFDRPDSAMLSMIESGIDVDAADVADGFQVCTFGDDPLPGAFDEEGEPVYIPPKPSTPEECIEFLERFFANKQMYYGGPIPKNILLSERHVELVLRLDFDKCIKFFHKCLDEQQETNRRWRRLEKRLELFFYLQKESHDLNIPRHHSGGLLLVYLILCLGYSI